MFLEREWGNGSSGAVIQVIQIGLWFLTFGPDHKTQRVSTAEKTVNEKQGITSCICLTHTHTHTLKWAEEVTHIRLN